MHIYIDNVHSSRCTAFTHVSIQRSPMYMSIQRSPVHQYSCPIRVHLYV